MELGIVLSAFLATPNTSGNTPKSGRNKRLHHLVLLASAVELLHSYCTGIIATRPSSTEAGFVTTATQASESLGTISKAS
jgi:hypothetical protein